MNRCGSMLVVAVAFMGLLVGRAHAATPKLTVARILQDGRQVPSAADVTLRGLDNHLLQRGLQQGQALPDDVRVQIPSDDTVSITAPNGRDSLTLHPNSSDSFQYTGMREIVSVSAGKTDVDDTYGFFSHVNGAGGIVATAPTDPVFSIEVSPRTVTVSSRAGVVHATLLGSGSAGSASASRPQVETVYGKRVDRISPGGRASITYTLGQETTANVSVADDEAAARHGNAHAEFNLASRYYSGNGVPQDYATALHWYQLAAAHGNSDAERNIGYMYLYGNGVPLDYTTALHWFQLAAAQSDASAESNVGYMYQYGLGVTRDYANALRYFQSSAALGSAKGEASLGVLYANGLGVLRNDVAALHDFQLAAAQGDAFGESNLGWMYDPRRNSQGVAPDYATALRYYQLSALQIRNASLYVPASSPQGLAVTTLIQVGQNPQRAVITPNGHEVYVTDTGSRSVSVIDTGSDTVTNTLQVGEQPAAIVVSRDGRYVYVANNGGDVSVIDTSTKNVQTISTNSAPVRDLAITPDSRRLFLAMEWSGLQVVDLSTRTVEQVSESPCPEGLAMTPDGKRLYVNYQCSGPGGRPGHDALAVFNLNANRPCSRENSMGCELSGTILGLPNVGGQLALSPDGTQLWLNGNDACSQPAYDHAGCAMVPGDVVNVIDASTDNVLKTIIFRPGEGNGAISFLPNGGTAIIGGGTLLKVMDWRHLSFLQPLPIFSAGVAAFAADGSRAFLPVGNKNVVAVVKVI